MQTIDSLIVGCIMCDGTGWVCENHPYSPWGGVSDMRNACECGAGMLCECSKPKEVTDVE